MTWNGSVCPGLYLKLYPKEICMKNLRGIIVAAVFGALTVLLQQLAQRYSLLLDMAYPFASKTVQEVLSEWSGGVDFCVWQVILAVFLIAVVVSIGLMILFRWNFFRWLGWVLAPVSIAYFLFTCVWGLNYYNRPIQESMKLETGDYTVADLRDATEFYRQQADRLAGQMDRDENGDLILADLDTLNQSLETAFDNLVWDYSIFSGSRGPVKALGWDSLFSRFGTAGVTVGLTGEAAVNMDEYAATIPFNMCHEVAHLLAIAVEDEANFAGYLACEYSDDPVFQYSGYMMAYLYCSNELYKTDREAWQEIRSQAAPELLHDLNANNQVYEENQGAVRDTAQTVYDSYLQSNGQETGVESYNMVTGLLVAWHQEKYVIREDETEPTVFDPYNYDEVFPESPAETTEPAASTEEG